MTFNLGVKLSTVTLNGIVTFVKKHTLMSTTYEITLYIAFISKYKKSISYCILTGMRGWLSPVCLLMFALHRICFCFFFHGRLPRTSLPSLQATMPTL